MASNVAADEEGITLPELDRLELTLRRLLDAFEQQQQRLRVAETRISELENAMQGVSSGALDPLELGERVRELEAENGTLRARIQAAEALVQRIHARLQFVEDER